MKLRCIFVYYINFNESNNVIYNFHHFMLNKYSHIFDTIDVILSYNKNDFENVIQAKHNLINTLNCNNINFYVEENDPQFREGLMYKKYVIDKLDEYKDELIFFGHTKGVSNDLGLKHLDNLKKWIFSLYYLNFNWLSEVKHKLLDYSVDYVTYGALYFKDYRHNNINNWFYSGSFQWINPKRLLNIINENNIDISLYLGEANERLKRCAELFPGYILNEKYVGFHMDERYNKSYESFNIYGWEISYLYIYLLINEFLNIYEYEDFEKEYNIVKNELS